MDTDFGVVLALLQKREVEFIVVGGVACALNGFVRTTEDLDILVRSTPENISRVFAALSRWGDGYIRDLTPEDFAPIPGAIRLEEDFVLDMFTLLADKTYEEFLPDTRETEDGLKYLSPAGLIETKRNSVREKDQIDVIAMRRLERGE